MGVRALAYFAYAGGGGGVSEIEQKTAYVMLERSLSQTSYLLCIFTLNGKMLNNQCPLHHVKGFDVANRYICQ